MHRGSDILAELPFDDRIEMAGVLDLDDRSIPPFPPRRHDVDLPYRVAIADEDLNRIGDLTQLIFGEC
jgi:hypothetical protein